MMKQKSKGRYKNQNADIKERYIYEKKCKS